MPSQRGSLKNFAVEIVLFVGLFALIGHLTLNFWERYVIQSELSSMKASLDLLKTTINGIGNSYDILYNELKVIEAKAKMKPITEELLNPNTMIGTGNAYDKLHNEFKAIVSKAEMKPVDVFVNQRNLDCCRNKYTLDRSLQHVHQIQTMMKFNKSDNFNWSECAGKNATTITKYPKSVGVGSHDTQEQTFGDLT